MLTSIGDALHGHFHVLLQIVEILLFQSQGISKLSGLSFQNKVLFREVLRSHLVKQLLSLNVFEIKLIDIFLHEVHL